MLPFGHVAAGYLIADAITKASGLPPEQTASLTLWGIFFAFAPDLDTFYSFWRAKSFTVSDKSINHRHYLTHRPMLWLATSLVLAVSAPSPYWRWFGMMILAGSWSHFALDSIRTGVAWLWPLQSRLYALREPGAFDDNPAKGFFRSWLNMLRLYKEKAPLVFYLEIAVIAAAILKIIYA